MRHQKNEVPDIESTHYGRDRIETPEEYGLSQYQTQKIDVI